MATSGTYTFNPSADDILTEAWERLGKNPAELTGDVARAARRSLAYQLIEWTAQGFNLWQVDRQTLTLTAGQSSYTLDSSTIEPLDLMLSVSGQDRPLSAIGRSDYAAIPVKAQAGAPNQYWCERLRDAPVLHLYPTPEKTYTLAFYRLRQPQDLSALGQNTDTPMLWADALAAALAVRLAVKYAPERVDKLAVLAAGAVKLASGENRQRNVPFKLGIRRSR